MQGEKYNCQLLFGSNEARDVILNVNLAGIKLLEPINEVFFLILSIETKQNKTKQKY